MKRIFILFLMFVSLLSLRAQTDFARTFSSACGQAGNVSFTLGQPFYQQVSNASGLEVAEGVQQAQILYKNLVLEGCQNADTMMQPAFTNATGFMRGISQEMTFNGRPLTVLPAGHYDSTDVESRHYSWDGPFNYDSVTTLVLDVWPIYEGYDTLRLDIHNLEPWKEGDNDTMLATIHDCDSLMHIYVLTCGEEITDVDGNIYNTLFVGPYCWTQQNLLPARYSDGDDIPNSMIYYSPEHPDEAANLSQYGRLYTWYSAVNVPEGSTSSPALVDGVFVQGICPDGWHIPSERNMVSLTGFGAPALKSTILWLQPGDNSTGFTSYPAGFYNPNTDRFENMLGETHYWTTQNEGSALAKSGVLSNNCDEVLIDTNSKNYGFSVRCVKNQSKNL